MRREVSKRGEKRRGARGLGGLPEKLQQAASPEVMDDGLLAMQPPCRSAPRSGELQACLGGEQCLASPKQPSPDFPAKCLAHARTKPHTYKVKAEAWCLSRRLLASRELSSASLPITSPATAALAPRATVSEAQPRPSKPQGPAAATTDRRGNNGAKRDSAHPRDLIVSPPAAPSPPETSPPHASSRRSCACAPSPPPKRLDNAPPLISCANASQPDRPDACGSNKAKAWRAFPTFSPAYVACRPAASSHATILPRHVLPTCPPRDTHTLLRDLE